MRGGGSSSSSRVIAPVAEAACSVQHTGGAPRHGARQGHGGLDRFKASRHPLLQPQQRKATKH